MGKEGGLLQLACEHLRSPPGGSDTIGKTTRTSVIRVLVSFLVATEYNFALFVEHISGAWFFLSHRVVLFNQNISVIS